MALHHQWSGLECHSRSESGQPNTLLHRILTLMIWGLFVPLSLSTGLSSTELSAGEIYKWVDEQGQVQFSDQPPEASTSAQAEKIVLKPEINTVKGTDISVSDYLQTVQEKRAQAEKLKPKRDKPVVMYSTTWCGVCKRARQYFIANNIPFSEYDIEKSERGRKDYARLNGTGIPIILVGKKRMNGFSPGRFQRMYPH